MKTYIMIFCALILPLISCSDSEDMMREEKTPTMQFYQVSNYSDWNGRIWMETLSFKDKLWLIGGFAISDEEGDPRWAEHEQVWSSINGTDWDLEVERNDFRVAGQYQSVVFDGKAWLVGYNGRFSSDAAVHSSSDGLNWDMVSDDLPFPRASSELLVYQDKMWNIGEGGDIWNTTNGRDWTQVTPQAGFPPRTMHENAVVFDDKIWVFGYFDLGDAWCSEDGEVWTQVADGLFTKDVGSTRSSISVFGDQLVYVGGSNFIDGDIESPLYTSANGVDWQPVEIMDTTQALEVFQPNILVHNDRLWVIGGSREINNPNKGSEVWFGEWR